MMNNLFSMFDPSSNCSISMNWFSMFIPAIFLMKKYWNFNSRKEISIKLLNNLIFKDLKNNLKNKYLMNLPILITLFYSILIYNLSSIAPFIFAPTSHIWLSLFFSLSSWLSMMYINWSSQPMNMLTHMVPKGTPIILCPFMVLIETISMLIRPFTLAIRLTANIIAGHILISLLSKLLISSMLIIFFISLIINILLILEISVAFIQSYVFIILLSLYLNENEN